MSKISKAHFELTRYCRWKANELLLNFPILTVDDVDVISDVRGYHTKDNYREIIIKCKNESFLVKFLKDIQILLGFLLQFRTIMILILI